MPAVTSVRPLSALWLLLNGIGPALIELIVRRRLDELGVRPSLRLQSARKPCHVCPAGYQCVLGLCDLK